MGKISHNEPGIRALFGAQFTRLVSSNRKQEEQDRTQFLRKYGEMHRLVKEPNGNVVLYIGTENWSFPVPLAHAKGGWYFDTDAGAEEIMCRHIGEDEANTMQVCHAMARAQKRILVNSAAPKYGYYFRTVHVAAHGSGAKSGGNVAVVAYPSEYRVTGVKTFMLSPQGVLYEKDLGESTIKRVKAMTRLRVDSTWKPAQ